MVERVPRRAPWPVRLGGALALTAAAVAVSAGAAPFFSRSVFLLLWPAVIFSAWFGGFGAAVAAAAAGVLAIDYLLIPPRYQLFDGGPVELAQMLVFMLASGVIARLADRARLAQVKLEEANAELAAANTTLQEQSIEIELTLEEAQTLNEELRASSVGEETARQRLAFLSHASEVLSSSLDYDVTLRHVARLCIERLADWCAVELRHPDGRSRGRAVAHRDPARVQWAEEFDRRYAPDPDAPAGAPAVFRTGRSELYPHVTDEMLVATARDDQHLRDLREGGFRSVIIVPITAHERVFGTITLISSVPGRSFDGEDLVLAEDLGRRAGAAIENAELLRSAERSADRARRLQSFATALNRAVTLAEVVEVCVVNGFEAVGADAGSLALLREGDAEFEIAYTEGYASGVTERWRRFPVTPGRPLSDAVRDGVPRLAGSPAEMGGYAGSVRLGPGGVEMRAFAAVPLAAGGRTLGGLSFSFIHEQTFDEAERAFMLTLGEQAAQAIARARLLEEERAARTEAQAANQAKSDFLSAMSHELRTPLNAIGGYVDLIAMEIRGPVTPAQRDDLERVQRAQKHLLTLINDILGFARIEAGRIQYQIGPVPVAPLLDELGELMEPQIRARGLEYECSGGGPDVVARADPERTRQILLNLLANAVKFTDSGAIRISAQPAGKDVRITVEDTGRGVPEDRLAAIFDPFVQVDRNLVPDGQQGVGLGLAISRELAVAMAGNLTAASEPGRGSAFVLTLPRHDSDPGGRGSPARERMRTPATDR